MRIKPTQSLMSLFVVMIGLLVASATAAASTSAAPYMYVANYDGSTVTEYEAKNASGNQPPVAAIEGDHTGLRNPAGLTLNSAGLLFVTNYGADSVTQYASGAAGNVAPIATIKGALTGSLVLGDALDAAGDLFVTNYGDASVTEYAPRAVGDVAPIATIKGPKTGLSYPEGVFVEPSGVLVVASTWATR